MLEVGDQLPVAAVWTTPNERTTTHDLLAEGTVLFLFYLFDWSST